MHAHESKALQWTRHGLIYVLLTLGGIVMIFPLIWTFSTSLKPLEQVTVTQINLIPDPIKWTNYVDIFSQVRLTRYVGNTLIIVAASLFGGLITCSLAGFAFARLKFPGRDALFIVLLATMMLPYVVQLIPLFIMFDSLGMVGTFWPLVIPRLLGHNAFYIFLLRQFYKGLPGELFDAARIDGCSEFGVWWRIAMPNSKPVLAAVAIFSFQFAWNDFLNPLIYLGPNPDMWTLALALNALKGGEGQMVEMNMLMVLTMFMILPMLLMFAFGQKYMVRGVTLSGVKG